MPGASIPSTVADWSPIVRWVGSAAQVSTSVGTVAWGVASSATRASWTFSPGVHLSMRYGPVPDSERTLSGLVARRSMAAASRTPSAGCATRARNAPSGSHRVNTTVLASRASIRPRLPV